MNDLCRRRRSVSYHTPWRSLVPSGLAAFCLLVLVGLTGRSLLTAADLDSRGTQFLGFTNFSGFAKSAGAGPGECVLTSPEITTLTSCDQLLLSWNTELPDSAYLKVEARALNPGHATKYYVMGLWSPNPSRHPRESVPHQKDADGDVSTDTLILKRPCERFQVRLTLGGGEGQPPKLKFLGICLTDTQAAPPVLPPNRAAWGKTIEVPERSQMVYPNGGALCSPTTVAMLMSYWANQLKRPEIDRDVPEIVKAIYDAQWHGTGNWPFNMAYAGGYAGMRAYVTRLSDVAELEDWVARGLPVGLSLCYDRLRAKGPGPNGHLVVCVGFTKEGDVIINDPGTRRNVRKTFPRKNLISAWAYSHNTVYLIYPAGADLPHDPFGHWDSSTSRERIRTYISDQR